MKGKTMKVGDIIVMEETWPGFYKSGDKAKLYYQDDDGDWWADFTINNYYEGRGKWCIGNKPLCKILMEGTI